MLTAGVSGDTFVGFGGDFLFPSQPLRRRDAERNTSLINEPNISRSRQVLP